MNEEIIEVRENSPGTEIGEISAEDEAYLQSARFNRGKRKNIEVNYERQGSKAKLRVGPYAGIIQLSKKRIHFSTKVSAHLFYMLSFLRNEDEFLYDPDTPIEMREGVNFFDIIGKFFLNFLNEILRRGLLKKYVRRRENSHFIKGKILIRENIRENMVGESRFLCEYGDLTFDNLENRIVLSALNSLISMIRFNTKIRNELRKTETVLKDFITLVNINPQECKRIRFNRINLYYEDIIRLSRLILEERFIRSIHKGQSRGFNFIVNMNKVYEDFVTEIIEDVFHDPDFKGFTIESQSRFSSLVEEGRIRIKPDMVIKNDRNEYPFIIDAKYKREEANVDYYQVIAYSLALRSCEACCLLYPQSEASETGEAPLTLVRDIMDEKSKKVRIFAKTVDLYLTDDELLEYEEYITRIKAQVKQIIWDFLHF